MPASLLENEPLLSETEEEGDDDEGQHIESWDDWESDEDESLSDYLCLFCDTRFDATTTLFDHCKSQHSFDFHGIIKELGLDFYGSIKLINYVRSQVAENKCWDCGLVLQCKNDLLSHLHAPFSYREDGGKVWDDDVYLRPFIGNDALLHSFFGDDDDGEDDCTETISREEAMRELVNNGDLNEMLGNDFDRKGASEENVIEDFKKISINGSTTKQNMRELHQDQNDKQTRVFFANTASREIKNINENYFGSYGSFGIHWEMISDKVRTDAYRDAILHNPSLLNQATVLDVGCGTGILSLFAAQAGASRVIAVEASTKMASVATQIAKDNGLLSQGSWKGKEEECSGVISVVHTMVEDLDKHIQIQPHSLDVLVSEWMGYCLLFESMLTSVLYARDHWLKPGGAMLPDTATIYIAGFGRGGTSLPFWENVYGFSMSCIGKEVVEDAAKTAIVDVVDSKDIVTESAALKFLDLATMRPDDIDFTACAGLELKSDLPAASVEESSGTCWCHGIVLWFETGFTNRFCKEKPLVLSTSPYEPKTHWSQTIFTFQEPIAMASSERVSDPAAAIGTRDNPVVRISTRISIARSSHHRSIDISMETTGISLGGRKRSWPAQIFKL